MVAENFVTSLGINFNVSLDVDSWCPNLSLGIPPFEARFTVKSKSIVPQVDIHSSFKEASVHARHVYHHDTERAEEEEYQDYDGGRRRGGGGGGG
jgi:hypothetical protein